MMLSGGTRLGLYEIVAPVGAWGMGEVYRARDTRLGREVAIKVLPRVARRRDDARCRESWPAVGRDISGRDRQGRLLHGPRR